MILDKNWEFSSYSLFTCNENVNVKCNENKRVTATKENKRVTATKDKLKIISYITLGYPF